MNLHLNFHIEQLYNRLKYSFKNKKESPALVKVLTKFILFKHFLFLDNL